MKSGNNNNYQKYDGLRVITHEPHNMYILKTEQVGLEGNNSGLVSTELP